MQRDDLRQMPPDHRLGDLDRLVLRADRLRHRGRMLALVRRARRIEAGGEGQHRLAVQPRHQRQQRRRCRCRPTGTCRTARRCADADRRSPPARGPAGPTPRPRRCFPGRPRACAMMRRRSSTWPSAQVSVSPGSTRWMPSKIVSVPVVNCSLQQFLARRGPHCAWHQPASSSACGSEAKARPPVWATYSGLMPNGSRVSVTVRCGRSWMAIAYMPRRCRA